MIVPVSKSRSRRVLRAVDVQEMGDRLRMGAERGERRHVAVEEHHPQFIRHAARRMAIGAALPGAGVHGGLLAHELGQLVQEMVDHVVDQLARKLMDPVSAMAENR